MRAWAMTSFLLVGAMLLLRPLLCKKLRPRLRYFLWLPVLVRLLLPLQLGYSRFSVMNAFSTVRIPDSLPGNIPGEHAASGIPQIVLWIWLSGFILTALWFSLTQLRLLLSLRRSRKRVTDIDAPLTVYITEAVESPCLFGLFHPSIYLTPEALDDRDHLSYILTHELTHFHHGDHLWSALRALCLALHWYNPLVWLAAALSRQDGELACDESAVRILGDHCREDYGRMLISMTCTCRETRVFFPKVNRISGGGKHLGTRIKSLSLQINTSPLALAAVLLLVTAALTVTFTDAVPPERNAGFEALWQEAPTISVIGGDTYEGDVFIHLNESGTVLHLPESFGADRHDLTFEQASMTGKNGVLSVSVTHPSGEGTEETLSLYSRDGGKNWTYMEEGE